MEFKPEEADNCLLKPIIFEEGGGGGGGEAGIADLTPTREKDLKVVGEGN